MPILIANINIIKDSNNIINIDNKKVIKLNKSRKILKKEELIFIEIKPNSDKIRLENFIEFEELDKNDFDSGIYIIHYCKEKNICVSIIYYQTLKIIE